MRRLCAVPGHVCLASPRACQCQTHCTAGPATLLHRPALDVELRDTWPAQNFVKLSGPDVMTWARVEPGQEVSQSVVLQAHTAQEGTFSSSRASVDYTYGEGDDAIDRRAYSSSLGTVRVYTEAGYKRAVQRFTLEWTTFLALGAIVTVLPFVSFTLMRKAAATKAKAA